MTEISGHDPVTCRNGDHYGQCAGATLTADHWKHNECRGVVVFGLSGGFCTRCHAENLEAEDCHRWLSNSCTIG